MHDKTHGFCGKTQIVMRSDPIGHLVMRWHHKIVTPNRDEELR